jgi:hypothetical protein
MTERSPARQTIPGGRVQGPSEDATYVLDTTRWGGTPVVTDVRVIRSSDSVDVADTVTTGVFPVSGDNISLRFFDLEEGEFHFVEVDFTTATQPNGLSAWFTLPCA